MMKMKCVHIALIGCLVLVLCACNQDAKKTPATPVDTVEFSIPKTTEEVKETFDNGVHKSSVYYHEETKEKVAEVTFHENGQPYTQRAFKGEIMDGESKSYYKNGNPWSVNTYKDGVYHGKYKTWHENGQVNIDGNYSNGKPEGDWLFFYPNGQIDTRGIFREGKKVGVWTSYNEDGTLIREVDYDKQ
jgi:antitoxin component YwqK of YwqJK toxin-antitoxin module